MIIKYFIMQDPIFGEISVTHQVPQQNVPVFIKTRTSLIRNKRNKTKK